MSVGQHFQNIVMRRLLLLYAVWHGIDPVSAKELGGCSDARSCVDRRRLNVEASLNWQRPRAMVH